jgi:hypothetical protein
MQYIDFKCPAYGCDGVRLYKVEVTRIKVPVDRVIITSFVKAVDLGIVYERIIEYRCARCNYLIAVGEDNIINWLNRYRMLKDSKDQLTGADGVNKVVIA